MLRSWFTFVKALIKADTLIVPGLNLHTDWFSVLGSLVSKVFLLALKAFFKFILWRLALWVRKIHSRPACFLNSSDTSLWCKFFVPAQFCRCKIIGLKLMCVNYPAWKSFSGTELFYYRTGTVFKYSSHFLRHQAPFLLWFCFQNIVNSFVFTHFVAKVAASLGCSEIIKQINHSRSMQINICHKRCQRSISHLLGWVL
jgi:hypothetical protein